MFKRIIILLVVLIVPFCISAQSFKVGERLEFKLKYGILAAGNSYMQIVGIDTVHGHVTYKIENQTKSSGFVDTFYKVRDRMVSWIDTTTLATVQFQKSLREGKYRKNYSVWFDYDNMKAYSTDDTLEIETEMHDVLSLFYYIRKIDIAVGDTIEMQTYDNDKISPFLLRVADEQEMDVPAGKFMSLKLIPFSESGLLFKYEGEGEMWITDDTLKMPLYVKSKASFGSIILELEKYSPEK